MTTIRDVLKRDLQQPIEEIIKVNQADEQAVHTEITEYVATERIKAHYRELLRAIADSPTDPHERIGVWISGFFGSGKSSFAKNLGYILANRQVLGTPVSELFKAQVADRRVSEYLDSINRRIPTEVIMFDVQVDRTKQRPEPIAEIMYKMLLRELDYAEDYDMADLEIELEQEGKLDDFARRCEEMYGQPWRIVRKGAQRFSRASAVLHAIDPRTFPTPDSWSQSLRDRTADVTVGQIVERSFELCARRRPGKALVFVIDEVGQYVARSDDRIEDLRAVVEEFGRVSQNLVKAHRAPAPVWVVVTSQEKLEEVVAAIDSKRVELPRLQDRFRHRVDLAPADIREVATRRVLAKKESSIPQLEHLYHECQGQLTTALRLERTSRRSEISRDEFVQFYPYPPHFVELSIDIVSGIRLEPGAPRHVGGSNRTIIKQAYEMLVSPRTALADRPLGALVTMDRIYELVEGNLSTERQKDIADIRDRFGAGSWDERVAKTVCLLEFVRDLPRTEANIAACLVDSVDSPAPLAQVAPALERLHSAQFVRNTEEGWKLQTAQEKNWETERSGHLDPKPKDRNDILREALSEVFTEPRLRTYRFRNLRAFQVGVCVDGVPLGGERQVPLSLWLADDGNSFADRVAEARNESRQPTHQNDLYWVAALTSEIDHLVANLYASRQMIAKYGQLSAQNRIGGEEAECLQNERTERSRLEIRLRAKLTEALQGGTGLFRGVAHEGASLGKGLPEILTRLYDIAVPDLYPKLEMGARPLKGTEAEELLKAANLNGLPQVFYGGETGLNLVVKQGAAWVPNQTADVAKEILDYLVREHSYGNSESRTGKAIDAHFGGLGYGWERDMLRVVLATLFRAGAIEVSHGGQRFEDYRAPQARLPFTSNPAFRSALFTPVKPIDLKTLTAAVKAYEALTGKTVDVEKNEIAAAAKRLAQEELRDLVPVAEKAKLHGLPFVETIEAYEASMKVLRDEPSDACVSALAGEGGTLRKTRERIRSIRQATGDEALRAIRHARTALNSMWPVLRERGEDGDLAAGAQELQQALASERLNELLPQIKEHAGRVAKAYMAHYSQCHDERTKHYEGALARIEQDVDWPNVPDAARDALIQPLLSRACRKADLGPSATICARCGATIAQMESDVAALPGFLMQALERMRELAAPTEGDGTPAERVRVAEYFDSELDTEAAIEASLERLRDHLQGLLARGYRIIVE